jgi:hypothetical protein
MDAQSTIKVSDHGTKQKSMRTSGPVKKARSGTSDVAPSNSAPAATDNNKIGSVGDVGMDVDGTESRGNASTRSDKETDDKNMDAEDDKAEMSQFLFEN